MIGKDDRDADDCTWQNSNNVDIDEAAGEEESEQDPFEQLSSPQASWRCLPHFHHFQVNERCLFFLSVKLSKFSFIFHNHLFFLCPHAQIRFQGKPSSLAVVR